MFRFLAMSFSNCVMRVSASLKTVAMAVCSVLVGGNGIGRADKVSLVIPLMEALILTL